jgi:hypothetical protein
MARPAAARAPMPEPTLAPLLAWMGPVVLAGLDGVLLAGVLSTVMPGRTDVVGVGGEAGTTVAETTGTVLVPLVAVKKLEGPTGMTVEEGQKVVVNEVANLVVLAAKLTVHGQLVIVNVVEPVAV